MVVALVLLPGMDGTGDLFAPLLAELGGDMNTVVVRYPGTTPLDYAALTSIAREALPRGQPYVILGESFSGPIAIELAAEAPKGLIGLILCASFVSNPMRLLNPLKGLVALAPIGFLAQVFGPSTLMGRFQTTAMRRLFRSALSHVSTAVLRSRVMASMNVDASAHLASVSVPTLYMRATEDRLLPAAAVEDFSRSARAGKVVSVPGPHCLLQCAPQAAGQVIKEFVSSLSQASNYELEGMRDG